MNEHIKCTCDNGIFPYKDAKCPIHGVSVQTQEKVSTRHFDLSARLTMSGTKSQYLGFVKDFKALMLKHKVEQYPHVTFTVIRIDGKTTEIFKP